MARIYEKIDSPAGSGTGDTGPDGADSETSNAAVRFWLSGAVAVVSAIACLLIFVTVRNVTVSASLGCLAAAVCVLSLLSMRRAVRIMHFTSPAVARASGNIEEYLEQLDDRFAVFREVRAGDSFVDHLVVGPSGLFTLKTFIVPTPDGMPERSQIRAAAKERDDLRRLVSSLARADQPVAVTAVICLAPGHQPVVEQEEDQVWVVATEKIVPALLKRSGREGAITQGVNQTGAFSTDAVAMVKTEKALAAHWKLVVRKTMADYTAPLSSTPGPRQG